MADDDADDNKDDDNSSSGGGLIAPILALVAVLLVGVGSGYAVTTLVTTTDEEEEQKEEVTVGPLWENSMSVDIGEVLTNVRGSSGRNFVKVSVQIWTPSEHHANVSKEEVKAILVQVLEERLHALTMEELGREYVHNSLRQAFEDELNSQLQEVLGDTNPNADYIDKVVLNGLMVQ